MELCGLEKTREESFSFPLCGLVFSLSVVKHHKFSGLKQHVFIIIQLWWPLIVQVALLHHLLRVRSTMVVAGLCSHLKTRVGRSHVQAREVAGRFISSPSEVAEGLTAYWLLGRSHPGSSIPLHSLPHGAL